MGEVHDWEIDMHTWHTITEPQPKDGASPGVRRLRVPGGWLYQVESHEIVAGTRTVTRVWHPPVFVKAGDDD
jgi:hypothetical protein